MKALRDLAAGRMPVNTVPSLRVEGFGGETYAREPVAALFARYPERFDDALSIEGATAACVGDLAGGTAFFADLHAGTIVRLWRLGPAMAPANPVRRVAVATDHDLSQRRVAVHFDPVEYPELRDTAAIVAAAAATAGVDFGLDEPPLRTRVFVRRAFTAGEASAALFGLAVLANGAVRRPLTCNVVALCYPGAAPRLIIDRAGLAAAQASAWTPHL